MHDAESRRFVIRDRNWHPKALTPDYKTSVPRSPSQALVSIPQSLSETSGPDFSHLRLRPPRQRPAAQLRPRRPAPGRAHHHVRYGSSTSTASRSRTPWWRCGRPTPAGATGTRTTATWRRSTRTSAASVRTLTDSEGHYYFRTIKPGPYPWRNGPNDWRPAHIHVSVSGPAIAARLVTQMYFEGDPLIPKCPIIRTLADPEAAQSLIEPARHEHGQPDGLPGLPLRHRPARAAQDLLRKRLRSRP